jgi:allantoinase
VTDDPVPRWGLDPTADDLPRDMVGYGERPPHPQWPGGARIAVSFVLNIEEGGENNVLQGDPGSETFLSEIIGAERFADRHMSMESLYEYGTRAGAWRVLRAFADRDLPLTIFGVARALQANPDLTASALTSGHEIAGHGLRWISYQDIEPEVERSHLVEAVRILTDLTGTPPAGWYTGRDSPHTRALVVQHGGFLYDSDSYADDLPYWVEVEGASHLVLPYALDTNDMRFATPQGFNTGEHFFTYCRDAFDALYAEGATAPKMLSIGLHSRIIGRPGRIGALHRLLDHVLDHPDVWACRRVDIARHWTELFPAPGSTR